MDQEHPGVGQAPVLLSMHNAASSVSITAETERQRELCQEVVDWSPASVVLQEGFLCLKIQTPYCTAAQRLPRVTQRYNADGDL